jgi:hypothetical protein
MAGSVLPLAFIRTWYDLARIARIRPKVVGF